MDKVRVSMYKVLKSRIAERSCKVGVIGLGYVGLPLAAILASKGYRVLGCDIRQDVVLKINHGIAPINEKGLQELVARGVSTNRLSATSDGGEVVKHSDAIFVVVQTPIDERGKPELSALKSVCATIARNLSRGKLIVVESTLPLGATKEVILPVLESSGLKAGSDFFLAYSPERAIPTQTLDEIQSNARIIGGITQESAELAQLIYRDVTRGELFLEDVSVVEMVKIIENTYRDVNIALANELAVLAERVGVDVTRAINLANRHPRVHLHMPGTGVGGHCIPKDPNFLIHKARELGMQLRIVQSARDVNENMPRHVLELVNKALESCGKKLSGSKIAVLGIAYKGNTDDTRGTPSKKIIETLLKLDCEVFSHDPFVTQDFGGKFSNNLEDAVRGADVVLIATDHEEYRRLDLKKLCSVMKTRAAVVDGRRILEPEKVKGEGMLYFGVGF